VKREFFPLSVVPAVPQGSGIRFLHPKSQYDITTLTAVVWAVLAETNGYQSADAITKKVAKRFPDESSPETVEAILRDLRSLGVVVDSREAFKHLHELSMNPMFFSQPVTFADIKEYTASSRLPVVHGDVLNLQNLSEFTSLTALQDARRSCRSFAPTPIGLDQVGHVLTRSYSLSRHTTPSAGGLYPVKVYFVVTSDQRDLPAGYYEYDPEKETCVRYGVDVDLELLQFAFDSDTLLFGAPVIVVIAADMERHGGKYSNRGYRYTILEAGHVAQNVQLSATEVGLSVLEYGGFLDRVLAAELGMDHPRVMPIVTLGLGIASNVPAFNAMYLLEELEDALVGSTKPVRSVRTSNGSQPEKGETFFAAAALYKPSPHQDTRRSYKERFTGGTATSAALAQVKALAEAYERYASSLVRVDRVSRAIDLAEPWLDPRKIAPLTNEQFRKLPFLQPFNPTAPWEWVKGQTVIGGQTVWVPVDLAFYPLNNKTFGRKLAHEASSSGVAAYTNEEEAVARGLLELIERDLVMRNWFKRESPRHISQDRLPYHWRRRSEYWESQGREVHVLDFSAYGAVAVNVLIVSPDSFPCFVNGSAASVTSFDEVVAKAFHEAELGLIQALKFPPHRKIRPTQVDNPMGHAKLYAHPQHLGNLAWLWAGDEVVDAPTPTASIDDLLRRFEAVLVRLSPEDAPLHVVRVLSEHLVPISFGYATEHHAHATIPSDQVHPDSLRLPHYFA
jgi:thiazole/oxazole-forming peptide maturase SagD family component